MKLSRNPFSFIFCALGVLLAQQARGERPEATSIQGIPSEFTRLLGDLKARSPKDPAAFLSLVRDSVGDDFTVALRSESAQGEHRAVLYPHNGAIVNTVGSNGTIEGVMETDGPRGLVPYEISFHAPLRSGDKAGHTVEYSPASCVSCHTDQHVYIWKRMPTWPAFVGRDGDAADKSDHQAAFSDPTLQPLLTKNGKLQSFPYPYLATITEPKLSSMPNSRFTLLVIARAARSVHNRIRGQHPDRYARYSSLLLRSLVCETDAQQADVAEFLTDYKAAYPKQNEVWDETGASLLPSRALALKVLHYLGTKPHQIILTEPWDESDSLASSANLKSMLEKQFGFAGQVPLTTPLDFGQEASLGARLAGLIATETKLMAPQEMTLSLAALPEQLVPNSDPMSSENQLIRFFDNPEFLGGLEKLAPAMSDIVNPIERQKLRLRSERDPGAAKQFCDSLLATSTAQLKKEIPQAQAMPVPRSSNESH